MVGVAVNVTLLPAQVGLVPEVIVMFTEGVTSVVIPRVIELLVAVVLVTQVRLVVITQVIFPAVGPASVYVAPVPTLEPSFFH